MTQNPFFVFIGVFAAALLAYQLDWSSIYPPLSGDVVEFFLYTFIACIILGLLLWETIRHVQKHVPGGIRTWVAGLLCLGFIADIAYTGGIPLWLVSIGQEYSYTNFGIPTLHVAIVTFGGTFAVVRFADYLYSKNRWYLLQAFLPIAYDILILNRGAALLAFISWMFVLVIKRGRIGFKLEMGAIAFLIAALFIFGLIGNMRSGENAIEQVGSPSTAFDKSGIPKPYFWTYIYLTSPIANFVMTTNVQKSVSADPKVGALIASEMLPDFISKRVLPAMGVEDRAEFEQISPALNVSTIFARAYVYAGWAGVVTMFVALATIIMLYVLIMARTAYAVPALALANTLIVFCVFDNMIAFTGMSLQLAWLLFLPAPKRFQKPANFQFENENKSDEALERNNQQRPSVRFLKWRITL